MNKSEIEGMIELIQKDPVLKQKFSRLIISILEEDSEFKTKLNDIVARQTMREDLRR